MSTNTLKCYNCGGTVIVGDNPNIGICSRCLAEVPVPKGSSSITEAHSRANLLLSESRFDEALAAFREILVHAPKDYAYVAKSHHLESKFRNKHKKGIQKRISE